MPPAHANRKGTPPCRHCNDINAQRSPTRLKSSNPETCATNEPDAATRAVAARNLYDRAMRTFVDGDTFIIGKSRRRLGTMLKRRRGSGRRTAHRAYSTRSAPPRRGETQ